MDYNMQDAMCLQDAMKVRHSVRRYREVPLPPEVLDALREQVAVCNRESGLHIQLVTDEPKAFGGMMARYGKFSGVTSYFALIGKQSDTLEETCGYYGQRLVLKAQQLGLNTCWVAMTYRKVKTAFTLEKGEKLCVVIALGYGETQGVAHKSKSLQQITTLRGEMPHWFENGLRAALLALNQQKFVFSLDGNRVSVQPGSGFYTKIDMGIAKYHFEIGAGTDQFVWA